MYLSSLSLSPHVYVIICICTVSFHNFKSQNFKLSVSNPKSKHVAYLSVLSQISNCQGLGRKNKHELLKTYRIHRSPCRGGPRSRRWRPPWCPGPRDTVSFCILYYTILYYTILYYTILYYTILYYTTCIYIYIYVYIYIYIYLYLSLSIYIYIYIKQFKCVFAA